MRNLIVGVVFWGAILSSSGQDNKELTAMVDHTATNTYLTEHVALSFTTLIADGIVFINGQKLKGAQIHVMNEQGEEILHDKIMTNRVKTVDLSHHPKANYVLRIQKGNTFKEQNILVK